MFLLLTICKTTTPLDTETHYTYRKLGFILQYVRIMQGTMTQDESPKCQESLNGFFSN